MRKTWTKNDKQKYVYFICSRFYLDFFDPYLSNGFPRNFNWPTLTLLSYLYSFPVVKGVLRSSFDCMCVFDFFFFLFFFVPYPLNNIPIQIQTENFAKVRRIEETKKTRKMRRIEKKRFSAPIVGRDLVLFFPKRFNQKFFKHVLKRADAFISISIYKYI